MIEAKKMMPGVSIGEAVQSNGRGSREDSAYVITAQIHLVSFVSSYKKVLRLVTTFTS
ncbi:hypothetical protein O9929_26340 [Vibrio lentus]|nr:hypothetical protein [Vibrio lentus]